MKSNSLKSGESKLSCSKLTLHSFQSENSWLRFDGETVNCLNVCINPLLLYWEVFPLSTHFGKQALFVTKDYNLQPAFKSSIGIYAMVYWIGLNGWQCNICAANYYTHSLLLQLDLSLLSVSDTSYIVYAPLAQLSLYQNCDLAPCTITRLSLVHTNKKACIRILW